MPNTRRRHHRSLQTSRRTNRVKHATRAKHGGLFNLTSASPRDAENEKKLYELLFSPKVQTELPLMSQLRAIQELIRLRPHDCNNITDPSGFVYYKSIDQAFAPAHITVPESIHMFLMICDSHYMPERKAIIGDLILGCNAEIALSRLIQQSIDYVINLSPKGALQTELERRFLDKSSSLTLSPHLPSHLLKSVNSFPVLHLMENFKAENSDRLVNDLSTKMFLFYRELSDVLYARGHVLDTTLERISHEIKTQISHIKNSYDSKLAMLVRLTHCRTPGQPAYNALAGNPHVHHFDQIDLPQLKTIIEQMKNTMNEKANFKYSNMAKFIESVSHFHAPPGYHHTAEKMLKAATMRNAATVRSVLKDDSISSSQQARLLMGAAMHKKLISKLSSNPFIGDKEHVKNVRTISGHHDK
jgi:hypothetical protein